MGPGSDCDQNPSSTRTSHEHDAAMSPSPSSAVEAHTTRRTALLSAPRPNNSSCAALSPAPAFCTRVLAWIAVVLASVGSSLYFAWWVMEYAPWGNPWESDVREWKIPRGGPEAPYVQLILMATSLVLAAIAAGTSEVLVGLRRWHWPFRRFFRRTAVEYVLWFLIIGCVLFWFLYTEVRMPDRSASSSSLPRVHSTNRVLMDCACACVCVPQITELQYLYGPPRDYSYGGYSYDGNSSYSYDGNGSNAEDGQWTDPPRHGNDPSKHPPFGPHGHHPHGPPHGFGPGGAKWVQALSEASRQAGAVSMLPIALLGVPLAKSSAMWRLAGLSYEEAVSVHRWLGVLAMVLTSFHTLGYVIVWMQPAVEFTLTRPGGLVGVYDELFTEHGVAGLNPWCDNTPQGEFGGLTYNPRCCGVSNLAGLIAWCAGLVIWMCSLECVRRSRYLLFIQVHQLHYVFFGFTCAHWSYGLFYMVPSAAFYAADIVLRWHGTYACKAATARVHGREGEPSMVTLVLPVPASAADATVVAAGGCPFLQNRKGDGSIVPLPPLSSPSSLADGDAPIEPSFATDPWAGTTCYLQTRHLSPLSAMGGWSHPFTVAGSVVLDNARSANAHIANTNSVVENSANRALLVHIAPERNWTLCLARAASKAGSGADVRMADVSVTSPLPAPPHLEHLAYHVMMGEPLLLIGAGSGLTPAVALVRMLASRTLPATACVRLLVIVRSMHIAEALDGCMLPAGADGATGLPWLTTELHLTRRAVGADDVEDQPSTAQTTATVHGFQGGFRLEALAGQLKATAAPYRLSGMPSLGGGTSRRVVINELATLAGAFVGFMAVTWPLVGAAANVPAPWSYQPTAISGMGALLLGWGCAMAGAWLALLVCDAMGYCSAAVTGAAATPSPAHPFELSTHEAACAVSSLRVPLASNGSRPCIKARLQAFADHVAHAQREAEETKTDEMLVAAGGPGMLFTSIEKTLPGVHVQRLTHPM